MSEIEKQIVLGLGLFFGAIVWAIVLFIDWRNVIINKRKTNNGEKQ